MIRLFTALSVPDDVAEALARRQTGLPGASWRTADQLHITLAFYGEIDERRADDLSIELERAATGGPFEVSLSGVGAFGDGHRTHAIWAGVEANDRLSVLAGRCRSADDGDLHGTPVLEPDVGACRGDLWLFDLQCHEEFIGPC
jgi:2'-5' RNA ligase